MHTVDGGLDTAGAATESAAAVFMGRWNKSDDDVDY